MAVSATWPLATCLRATDVCAPQAHATRVCYRARAASDETLRVYPMPWLMCSQVLSREEITIGLRARLGIEPSSVMIDNVIRAIDSDASDSISRAEYERLGSAPLRPAGL